MSDCLRNWKLIKFSRLYFAGVTVSFMEMMTECLGQRFSVIFAHGTVGTRYNITKYSRRAKHSWFSYDLLLQLPQAGPTDICRLAGFGPLAAIWEVLARVLCLEIQCRIVYFRCSHWRFSETFIMVGGWLRVSATIRLVRAQGVSEVDVLRSWKVMKLVHYTSGEILIQMNNAIFYFYYNLTEKVIRL